MLKQFNLLLLLSFTVACTLPLAVVQAGEDKLQNDEWQVISLYPPQGVYQAEILQQLVTAVEGLRQVQSSEGTPLLRSIDSLASMNVIVAQQDELRFRRIIEKGELDAAGITRLKSLVEEHPLVQRRLVSSDGSTTHLWLRLQKTATKESMQQLSNHLAASLNAVGNKCIVAANQTGPLDGLYMTQWQYESSQQADGLVALKALAKAQKQLSNIPSAPTVEQGRNYSALNLLSYLGDILGGDLLDNNGIPKSNAALSQIYIVAESLRSGDLQELARPDFSQLKLVVQGHQSLLAAPNLSHYQLINTSIWQASARDYRVLDCRAQKLTTSEK